ncbi:ABC transporter ATP-binding protein [Paraglaciecola sp. 2405UD69-4]|uniref:ABC transporter ATP-binding protein n=1 Tax=Paraglaciecola sp. 2405UD69-4 TaxID=3391836 RepID=UPI0039C99E1F
MLILEDISVAYQDKVVVDRVSFNLETGQIGCLLGPSGCGKTSILRAIAGFQTISSGSLILRDKVVNEQQIMVPPENRKVAIVFQDYALFPHLTVAQNIAFGLHQKSQLFKSERVLELLHLVNLSGYEKRYPHELSGGQQQRIALARAMAPKPDLLLLDEPFSSLDAELREGLAKDIRLILKHENTTALLVTHDQKEAFAMADMIGVISDGHLKQWSNAYGLYHKPIDKFVASFIGEGVFLPAKLGANNLLESPLGTFELNSDDAFEKGKNLVFLVRPDDIVHDDSSKTVARVVARTFQGSHILYELELLEPNYQKLLCLALSHHDHGIGEKFGIRLDLEHLIVFSATD